MILPVCVSIQSSEGLLNEADAAAQSVREEVGTDGKCQIAELMSLLKERISRSDEHTNWVNVWLDFIAWNAGFKQKEDGVGQEFLNVLMQQNKKLIALFEGFEELYSSVEDNGVVSAMKAALVELPQFLRSEVGRPLGMVAFVRQDTLEAAVPQNIDQFRGTYEKFALSWTDADVLQLAIWIANQANSFRNPLNVDFSDLDLDGKEKFLEELWGRKLGRDDTPTKRTKEAYASGWIIAVLSDFRGKLVPRDLVRLLAIAAESSFSDNDTNYQNRLLTPSAIKQAIGPTSESKVKEIEEEITVLKPIFQKFRGNHFDIVAPISKESLSDLDIDEDEVRLLKQFGILFGETSPYEVPELFRRGLRLKHTGARRSVVNLHRRAKKMR